MSPSEGQGRNKCLVKCFWSSEENEGRQSRVSAGAGRAYLQKTRSDSRSEEGRPGAVSQVQPLCCITSSQGVVLAQTEKNTVYTGENDLIGGCCVRTGKITKVESHHLLQIET